ncbi:MAG: 30S ribosomal protein S2 [Deltaproteobacteria bacterium]|nr:30S ribosomal protein S2 [Deltaproteobacteria bacterium]
MIQISIQEMLDAGAHFGHQTRRWNPKMKPYIYGTRSGVHIIDLQQTLTLSQKGLGFLEEVVGRGEDVLFVGTKKQAQKVVEEEAKRCSMPYVTHRWMGGTLTNFQTIKKSVDRLIDIETRRTNNDFQGYTKKELLGIDREIEKLLSALGGIRNMKIRPGALFVVDPGQERIAVHEAQILEIPVVAMTDSNCDPDPISYPMPANDDALRSIQLFTARAADACLAGLEKRELRAREEGVKGGGEMKKRPGRKFQEMEGGAGKAYVSRVDKFEEGEAVESFSAAVTKEEPTSIAEELAKEETAEEKKKEE